MNNTRRRRLRAMLASCEALRAEAAALFAEEDRARESYPENLGETPTYIRMDWACIHLEHAQTALDTAIAELTEATQ